MPIFYLCQTKSIFRPTSSHWILTFYSSLESQLQKQEDCKFLQSNFAQILNRRLRSFSWIHFFCTFFCCIIRFRKKFFHFCKFTIFFVDYWSRAQGFTKNVSNVIDFCNNKKIYGVQGLNIENRPYLLHFHQIQVS